METTNSLRKRSTRGAWISVIAVVVLLSAVSVWRAGSASKAMSAATGNEQELTRRPAGSKVQLVLEISEATPAGTLQGKLLQKKTEELYGRTTVAVTVKYDDHTKFVMGKRDDARAAAVVHVTGIVQQDHSVDAEQVVILTGYVRVQ